MITATVCLLIVLVVAWYSAQGIFSSFLHFVLTVLAGCLALALWEPIVYGALIGRMPEYAWGVGLLLPFGLILLVLRWTFDHYIPGNVNFHPMADKIGGGFFGLLTGVLTAGILVIGLQMAGLRGLLGYQGFEVTTEGEVARVGKIFPSVDTITAGFFDRLSGGSMSAIGSKATLATHHPNLAAEASLYNQPAFSDGSRRAAVPGAASLDTDESGAVKRYCIIDGESPLKFADDVPLADGQQMVVVPVRIAVQNIEGAAGSGDEDGIYRVTRNQMPLAAAEPVSGDVGVYYPIGYIQLGEYRALNVIGEFAYSPAGVADTMHYWVYRIPAKYEPRFVRVKGVRLDLPEKSKAVTDSAVVTGLRTYEKPEVVVNGDNGNGDPPPDAQWKFRVSNKLPWTFNKNRMQSVTFVKNAIASGRATLVKPSRADGRIQKNLAVNTIHHAPGAAIVQVNLGTRGTAGSLLGRVVEKAKLVTQAPILKDSNGATFFAIGYGILHGGSRYEFSIDPSNAIRSVTQIDLGALSDDSQVILYFQVPSQTEIVEFAAGGDEEEVDLKVP